MEEEAATDQANSMKPEDVALQMKHQAMLDRLSNRHQSRNKTTTTTTSTDSFLSKFCDSKRSIESQISESSKLATTDPTLLKSHLVDISSSISSLEQLVAENSFILPSYELRSALKTVSELRRSLENLNSELIPKKKFSFKNKSTTKSTPPDPKPVKSENPDSPKVVVQTIRDSPGIRNKTNQTLTKDFRGSENGEFTLTDLDSCEVRLIGSVNSLFFNRLTNCRVYSGPVIGSILIEEVENCVFVLASHQIRIHYAKGSDFYLRVRSRPIIEDCGGVRFAPYCLRYQGIEKDMREAGLEEETENWSNVDDFKWLRAVQSPNWSVLEKSERLEVIEIKDSGIVNAIS